MSTADQDQDPADLVVLLADDARPVGTAPRADVHTDRTPLHLAFSCHVTDGTVRIAFDRPEVRNAVMQNHTRLDWRDVIPHLSVPALVRVARRNVVFDWRGPHWVAEHLPDARERIFEDSRHALFLDEPQAFVEAVREFLAEADR